MSHRRRESTGAIPTSTTHASHNSRNAKRKIVGPTRARSSSSIVGSERHHESSSLPHSSSAGALAALSSFSSRNPSVRGSRSASSESPPASGAEDVDPPSSSDIYTRRGSVLLGAAMASMPTYQLKSRMDLDCGTSSTYSETEESESDSDSDNEDGGDHKTGKGGFGGMVGAGFSNGTDNVNGIGNGGWHPVGSAGWHVSNATPPSWPGFTPTGSWPPADPSLHRVPSIIMSDTVTNSTAPSASVPRRYSNMSLSEDDDFGYHDRIHDRDHQMDPVMSMLTPQASAIPNLRVPPPPAGSQYLIVPLVEKKRHIVHSPSDTILGDGIESAGGNSGDGRSPVSGGTASQSVHGNSNFITRSRLSQSSSQLDHSAMLPPLAMANHAHAYDLSHDISMSLNQSHGSERSHDLSHDHTGYDTDLDSYSYLHSSQTASSSASASSSITGRLAARQGAGSLGSGFRPALKPTGLGLGLSINPLEHVDGHLSYLPAFPESRSGSPYGSSPFVPGATTVGGVGGSGRDGDADGDADGESDGTMFGVGVGGEDGLGEMQPSVGFGDWVDVDMMN
ncbi:hypothetical protein HDU93_000578 [Gonapodya sp. JEL0774]|nr:hypothetical protein HDU93_000578 [Gonapodya sp. JEL0774]